MKVNTISFISFVLFLILGVNGFDPSFYPSSKVMTPMDYTVFWKLDQPNNEIFLAFKVKTTGWVGFGIAEITSGSMAGADIIIGNVINGTATITDRWSSKTATPDIDSCQDVKLRAAEETADGYTIIEVLRKLNTSDPQDRSIVSGPNRVIIAYGTSDTVGYHGVNRQTNVITFWGGPLYTQVPESDEMTMDLRIDNFAVPNVKTQYACQTFAVPTDADYMITQIDPIVNSSNIARVHHFVAHVAMNFSTTPGVISYVDEYQTPKGCMPLQGGVPRGATGILSAWAAGGGSQYAPPEAGFPMGLKVTSIKYIILEIHYNNPDSLGGYTDNSGIRIHFTKKLRQYEADVLIIGDPFTNFPPIPANQNEYELEAECKSSCTNTFPTDLKVFMSFPHMHQAGRKVWSTQWRNDQLVREIGRVEFFTYDHQQVQEVNFTINKGDRLNTHCVFQSGSTPVKFGMESTDEMCMHFLFYYPRMITYIGGFIPSPRNFCGRFYGPGYSITADGGTICGAADGSNFTDVNLIHPDPPGRLNTTFGVKPAVCEPVPTEVPTLPPTPAPCSVSLSLVAVGSGWVAGGPNNNNYNQEYMIKFANLGSKVITSVKAQINTGQATISQSWNINPAGGNLYTFPDYYKWSAYQPQGTITDAGFIIGGAGPLAPSISVSSVTCQA